MLCNNSPPLGLVWPPWCTIYISDLRLLEIIASRCTTHVNISQANQIFQAHIFTLSSVFRRINPPDSFQFSHETRFFALHYTRGLLSATMKKVPRTGQLRLDDCWIRSCRQRYQHQHCLPKQLSQLCQESAQLFPNVLMLFSSKAQRLSSSKPLTRRSKVNLFSPTRLFRAPKKKNCTTNHWSMYVDGWLVMQHFTITSILGNIYNMKNGSILGTIDLYDMAVVISDGYEGTCSNTHLQQKSYETMSIRTGDVSVPRKLVSRIRVMKITKVQVCSAKLNPSRCPHGCSKWIWNS